MRMYCKNCGEPALATDTVCWHCGMPIPGREENDIRAEQVKEEWKRTTSTSLVAIYAVITTIVIVGALLLMAYLGRLPLVQIGLGTRTQAEWLSISSDDKGFILSLPESWTWFDGAFEDQQAIINELVTKDPRYLLGTHPFGAEVDDVVIRFVAVESALATNQSSPFLVVGQSRLLNRLSYEEAEEFLLKSDYQVSQASFINNFDKSHLSIFVRTEHSEVNSLRCRQQFILGESEALLVSVCAPSSRYQVYANTFDDILSSFQRLDS